MIKDKIPEFDHFKFSEVRLMPYTITESVPIDPPNPESGHSEKEVLMVKVTRKTSPMKADGTEIPYRVKDLVRTIRFDALPADLRACLAQIDAWTKTEKRAEEGVE